MTINDTDTVKEFQTTVDGAFKETTTLSTKDKTRTVQFNVPDENADLLAHVNYEAPFNGGVHKGSADFRLAFDTTQATKVADSEFPVATPTEPEKPAALADGTYKIPFAAKHATEDKASSMQKYFDNPVYIQVKDGKRTAAMTINDTDTVKEFQTTVDGVFKETTTLSTKDKTRTVQFNVPDENADLLAHVNYEAPFNGGVHKGSADFRLAFDTTQATKVADSEFPVVTPTEPEKPAALADGTYKIPFAAKHATEDKASSMQKYFDNPVYIQVKDGKRTAAMIINDTDTVKEFQTTVDGAFKETTTLSTKDKTRTVQFNVPDENADLLAHVNYEAPFNGGIHKGSADFRLAFDTTQATKVADSEFPVATPTEPEKPAALADGTYKIPFAAKHATEDKASSMQKYFDKSR
ncbi:sortase B cell surface sorting signal domain-containing protein, partial [Brochothrix thermosphacta DSM 20171 = FSL F6-1036]